MGIVTRFFASITLLLALSGCATDMIAEAEKAPAHQDQIVLVGKIVIAPPPVPGGTGKRWRAGGESQATFAKALSISARRLS